MRQMLIVISLVRAKDPAQMVLISEEDAVEKLASASSI